jgi:hypothetical protein
MQLDMDEAELRQLPISIDPEVMSGVPGSGECGASR